MLNDADDSLQLDGGDRRLSKGRVEEDINDAIAVVGDGGCGAILLVIRRGPKPQLGGASHQRRQRADGAHGARVAEGGHLDGHGERRPERVAQLRLVDDDNELARTHLDHLLAEQSAAAALDKIQLPVDCVSTINRDVKRRMRVERDERDAERLCLCLRANRCWNRDDLVELARRELLPKPLHREVRSGPCAEADDHPRSHVGVDRAVTGLSLQLVLCAQLLLLH
mmetsp:Transcript_31451/g.73213  ORF Transcript_31451/g.73213 Transcript_31451/m.73213 type:complete len:225 (+) Transcript_31451:459-1133(+)